MAEPSVCAPIDANGDLTSDGTKTCYRNALNQLVEVKQSTTTLATFEYDGGGRRTEKTASGSTHVYTYDVEPYRVYWEGSFVEDGAHGKKESVLPRIPGARRSTGTGTPERPLVAVGDDAVRGGEIWVHD